MKLSIYLPSKLFLNEDVLKVIGESPRGSFCLLERHIDFVTALVPGIMSYLSTSGEERFLAVERGILVKQKNRVLVSTRRAIKGALGELKDKVDEMSAQTNEKEKIIRSSVARLEAGFIRKFMEFGKSGPE